MSYSVCLDCEKMVSSYEKYCMKCAVTKSHVDLNFWKTQNPQDWFSEEHKQKRLTEVLKDEKPKGKNPWAQIGVPCVRCENLIGMWIPKPDLFRPLIRKEKCPHCGSEHTMRIKKQTEKKGGGAVYEVIEASEKAPLNMKDDPEFTR